MFYLPQGYLGKIFAGPTTEEGGGKAIAEK
jgi:hypothetical protein